MKPVEPIFVVDLFEPMLDRLLQLLRQLSVQEWNSATPCEGWTVKDIALHLLGDEIAQLSRGRDKDTSSILPPGPDLVSRINAHNALWLEATRRMSTPLICDLLDVTDIGQVHCNLGGSTAGWRAVQTSRSAVAGSNGCAGQCHRSRE